MKILCSGELYTEPIEAEACLECALRLKKPPCGFSYPVLKAMFAHDQKEQRRSEVHVTEVVGCLLRAYYDKTSPVAEFPHHMLYKWIGVALHGDVERAMADDPHVQSEVPISNFGLTGRIDLVLGDLLLDLKTTRWLDETRVPYGSHDTQVNAYNAMGEDQHDLSIQYLDVSGPPVHKVKGHSAIMQKINGVVQCPVCGYASPRQHLGAAIIDVPNRNRGEMQDYLMGRVETLRMAVNDSIPPAAEPGWLCAYCEHTQCKFNPKGEGNGEN